MSELSAGRTCRHWRFNWKPPGKLGKCIGMCAVKLKPIHPSKQGRRYQGEGKPVRDRMPSAGRDEQPEQGSAAAGGRVGEFGRGRPPDLLCSGFITLSGAGSGCLACFAVCSGEEGRGGRGMDRPRECVGHSYGSCLLMYLGSAHTAPGLSLLLFSL